MSRILIVDDGLGFAAHVTKALADRGEFLVLDVPKLVHRRPSASAALLVPVIELAAKDELPRFRFESLPIASIEGDASPKWNKLFPLGVTRFRRDFPNGKITLSAAYLGAMVKNWERWNKPALPVDYWHDDDSPESIASGWIEDLELRADGLYGLIKWTAKARERIAADELRFLSPSFAPDMEDPTSGQRQGPTLLGAALLNKPFLFDLPRVAAGREPSTTTPKENTMLRTLLLTIFALPEVTTDETLADRVRALKAENVKLSTEQDEKIELTSKPLKVELAAARETVTKLEADVAKLKTEKQDAEIATFLGQLETDKKLLPANRESAKQICLKMGMDFARAHFAAAPAVVPTGEQGFKGKDEDAKSPEQATAQLDAEIARLQKEDSNLTYREARKLLGAQKPELLKLASEASAKKRVTA